MCAWKDINALSHQSNYNSGTIFYACRQQNYTMKCICITACTHKTKFIRFQFSSSVTLPWVIFADRYPLEGAMKKAFFKRNQWTIFQSLIQDNILDRCNGVLLASKPATIKRHHRMGKILSGKQRKESLPLQPLFFTCLQSSTSPHEHYAGHHSGSTAWN